MADGSAAAMARLLLAPNTADPDRPLATWFRSDPPLVLWTACVADRNDRFEPHGIDDLAEWLSDHLLEVLQWSETANLPQESVDGAESEALGDRVESAVRLADLASRLAAEEGPEAGELAYLHGLLHGLLHEATDWLGSAGGLPAWLAKPSDSPAIEAVCQAAAILADKDGVPKTSQIDLDAASCRAAECRRHWLAEEGELAAWLPVLSRKLGRLVDLEDRFEATLLTEKLEAMAEFAAGAGHEINNPLTVIAGRAQLFLREEKDPERRRALALMNAQAKRVYEMIADMMLFARPPQPETETVDLLELVDGLIDDLAPQAVLHETELRRTGSDGPLQDAPVLIEVDRTQLTVALRAMCQNAMEAIGRSGCIEIRIRGGKCDVQIDVMDDGPGILPEEHRHLFDPYYSARQAGRGLGLGLSKCWRIVTNHGGRIDVTNRPEQGAVFTITLPRQHTNPKRKRGD